LIHRLIHIWRYKKMLRCWRQSTFSKITGSQGFQVGRTPFASSQGNVEIVRNARSR
jgi:hypothetical protein